MYTHQKKVVSAGIPLDEAKKALILLHGRGARAEDILSLSKHLKIDHAAILAPQAAHNSWYPYSFLAPVAENQPALDSALQVIDELVGDIIQRGIAPENIYFAGFSQGACLTLEYTARHAQRFGGIIALTGGLIGSVLDETLYRGDFGGTPVFISTGQPDAHVPVERVQESEAIFKTLNADVTTRIYPGRPHTISADELDQVNALIFG